MVGVKIMKYTIDIIIGAIIAPSISPNLIQALLSGVKILEFNSPRIKKGNDKSIKYILI